LCCCDSFIGRMNGPTGLVRAAFNGRFVRRTNEQTG
jgi:hypothetical protein